MSYHRKNGWAMGDGPITDPSQVDNAIVIGTVAPTRVDCAALPADSPWKAPGQVCAPTPSILDYFNQIIDRVTGNTPVPPTVVVTPPATDPAVPAAAAVASSNLPSLLLLAGLGSLGYYLLRKKKRA